MEKFTIEGGTQLRGTVMLLTDEPVTLHNVPRIRPRIDAVNHKIDAVNSEIDGVNLVLSCHPEPPNGLLSRVWRLLRAPRSQ